MFYKFPDKICENILDSSLSSLLDNQCAIFFPFFYLTLYKYFVIYSFKTDGSYSVFVFKKSIGNIFLFIIINVLFQNKISFSQSLRI